jgi:hypothetical protein
MSKENKMGRACSMHGEMKYACRILVGELKRKILVTGARCMWKNSINVDLTVNIGWAGMDWIDLAQHRCECKAFVNKIMNFRVP